MVKHASSHGFAVLVCTIIAAFIIELLKPNMPQLLGKVNSLSHKVIGIFNIPLTPEFLSIVMLSGLLAMIWGIFFKIKNT